MSVIPFPAKRARPSDPTLIAWAREHHLSAIVLILPVVFIDRSITYPARRTRGIDHAAPGAGSD